MPAVFVTSSSGENTIVTDIFAVKDGEFTNVSFSTEADTSIGTLLNYYVYAEDIDADGILELPSLLTMKPVGTRREDEQKFLVRWYALDSEGWELDKLYTFHDYNGGWYLQLDGSWASRLTVEQEHGSFCFYVWDENYQAATPLFTLYVLTGVDRDEQASQNGRFPLYRSEGVAYAAQLDIAAPEYNITEESLQESFRLIRQDWQTGET